VAVVGNELGKELGSRESPPTSVNGAEGPDLDPAGDCSNDGFECDADVDFQPQDAGPATWSATWEPDWGDDELEAGRASSTPPGNSRLVCEAFPGHAGASLGIGTPKFSQIQYDLAVSEKPPTSDSSSPSSSPFCRPADSLLDPKLWPLACWLMSHGLTAGAREEFFKLDLVSTYILEIRQPNNLK
jgi:hypothetical protein